MAANCHPPRIRDVAPVLDNTGSLGEPFRARLAFEPRCVRIGEAGCDVLHQLLQRIRTEQLARFLDQRVREFVVPFRVGRVAL